MMFFEDFDTRLQSWVDFRRLIETDKDPLQKVVDFWNKAPLSSRICDPFDNTTWPDPWELLANNDYCEFSKILAIYYTLVLTERFNNAYFEIQISKDVEAHEILYLLIVDDHVIGYLYDRPVLQEELPTNLNIQSSYPMLDDKFIL